MTVFVIHRLFTLFYDQYFNSGSITQQQIHRFYAYNYAPKVNHFNAAKKSTSLPCGLYLVLRQRQRDPKMFFPAEIFFLKLYFRHFLYRARSRRETFLYMGDLYPADAVRATGVPDVDLSVPAAGYELLRVLRMVHNAKD